MKNIIAHAHGVSCIFSVPHHKSFFSIHSSRVWDVQEESQTVTVFCLLPSTLGTTTVTTKSACGPVDLAPEEFLGTIKRDDDDDDNINNSSNSNNNYNYL